MASYCSVGCWCPPGLAGGGIYNRLRDIWDWLCFSCGGARRGGDLVTIFRGVFGSAGEFLFWRGSGRWAIILWGLGTFLIFPNFLRF